VLAVRDADVKVHSNRLVGLSGRRAPGRRHTPAVPGTDHAASLSRLSFTWIIECQIHVHATAA
jgi:hypothetical protein